MNGAFNKQKKTREMILVGAPGFEPGASCAQASRAISWKSFLFNLCFEINELEKYLVVARCTEMWLRMRGVPRIFPIAKQQRNCFDRVGGGLENRNNKAVCKPQRPKEPLTLSIDAARHFGKQPQHHLK